MLLEEKTELERGMTLFDIVCPIKEKVPRVGIRHVQATLMFFYMVVSLLTRSTMSIAVVAMTNSTSKNVEVPYYNWDNTTIILSSFYWTYIILQPFSGYFFKQFGLRRCLLYTMLLNGVAFTLIPSAADSFGYMGVIACRMIQGLLQGFTFPACHASLGLWAPLGERSKLTVLIFSGQNVGTMLAIFITGYISSTAHGWPLVFYIFGAAAILWCFTWFLLGFDSPASHPKIGEAEKHYIMQSLEHVEDESLKSSLPIKQILTSLPFWSLAICNIGNTWGVNLLDLEVPTYVGKVLQFDIDTNGIISALPQVTQICLSLVFAPLIDYIVDRKFVSVMNCRRLCQIFGSLVPAAALVWLAFSDKSQFVLIIVLLNVIIGLTVFLYNASYINHVDISPRYAGLMLGIENSMSQLVGLTGPFLVHNVVTDMSNSVQWRHIFLLISVITVISSAFFMVFGSAEIQWWNSWGTNHSSKNVHELLTDREEQENKV